MELARFEVGNQGQGQRNGESQGQGNQSRPSPAESLILLPIKVVVNLFARYEYSQGRHGSPGADGRGQEHSATRGDSNATGPPAVVMNHSMAVWPQVRQH